jgi:DNA modification methylase
VAGVNQETLYGRIDLALSWSEQQLPQRDRTKHVHGIHPSLGKFVPQLAEELLRRHLEPGQTVLDPFCGSGTTLVEAAALGMHGVGCDVSAFHVRMARTKLAEHDLDAAETGLRATLERTRALVDDAGFEPEVPAYVARWYAPRAQRELLAYRAAIADGPERALAELVLTRAARSARLVPHFDLESAREPVSESYHCHKHKRTCHPTPEAMRFLRRYTADVLERTRAFAACRQPVRSTVLHEDVREADLPTPIDGIVTSPPYVGVIDYHGQHAYAYALLGLSERSGAEIGSARRGSTRTAVRAYVDDMASALAAAARPLPAGAPVVIVVNDRRGLYDEILERAGLSLESQLLRHVNRRTGRRAGEYFEEVLTARVPA